MVSIVSCLPVLGLLETDGGKLTRDKPETIRGDQMIKEPFIPTRGLEFILWPFGSHWREGEYQ